jgi:hypothetical protein
MEEVVPLGVLVTSEEPLEVGVIVVVVAQDMLRLPFAMFRHIPTLAGTGAETLDVVPPVD